MALLVQEPGRVTTWQIDILRCRRTILFELTRDELRDNVDHYGLDVDDRRVRSQLVKALAGSRRARLDEMLWDLSRDGLKELCRAVDLNDSGRRKADLVERLIGPTAATRNADAVAGAAESMPTIERADPPAATLGVEQLERYLWSAADILRGSIDSSDYKTYIFGLLFLKRLSDRFEEKAEKLVAEGVSEDVAWTDPDEHLNELVRPSGNIPKRIRELTGITNQTVADADTIDRVLPRVAAFVGDARVIAHNAHFDRRFLEHNARLMGTTFARNEWVCTMRMAQRVPLGGPYKLSALAERLDVPDRGSHRALDDCRATIGVYQAVRRLLGGSVSLAPLAPDDDGPAAAEVAYDADLSGQVFVFTGFRDEVLAARIGNAGGTVASGISRKVTTLLVADADATPTGKVRKAIDYGIRVRTKENFEQEFYIAQ